VTIFSRLVIGYLTIFILVIVLSLYAIVKMGEFSEVTHSVLMTNNRISDYAGKLSETVLSQIRCERKFIITEDLILEKKVIAPQESLRPLKEARDAFEKAYLIHLLEICEGNVSHASRLAGKYRADFYDLLRKHDLKIEEFKKQNNKV